MALDDGLGVTEAAHSNTMTVMKRMPMLALLLGVQLLVVSAATPSLGQSGDELTKLRKDIDDLKEGQKALQRDVQEIKSLLRAHMPPAAQGPQETLAQPVVLSIDGAPFLGNKDAQVALVEFSDFQCPFCARHSQQTLPAIVKDYVDAGKVKYVLRDFPIVALHPNAQKSHEAAHCASEQGKYWEMHDRLFGNIGGQEGQELAAQAKALRLDVRKFEQCLASGRHAAAVTKAIEEGQRAGVHGTPTFFVGVSGDGRTVKATRILRGAQPYERFKALIDLALSDVRQSR
jgi:protein-disulfide isomerase